METFDDLSIEPTGYDCEGCALYESDLIDLRWLALLDDVDAAGRDPLDFEAGLHALLFTDDVDLIRRGVEMIGLEAERHILRRGHPGLLDEESGRAWWRRMVEADLRGRPEYEDLRERAGWPADPADLDDDQLGIAKVVVLHPALLEDLIRRDED